MRRPWFAAIVLALTLAAATASAGERETVVLVAPTGDGFESRMRAELESMGFDVLVQGELTGDPKGVLAVARVVAGPPRRIEVVVVSTDASLHVPSRTAIIDASQTDDESVVSVRAAEQLRAFFQPLRPPTPPPPRPQPSPLARPGALPEMPASPAPLHAAPDVRVPPRKARDTWMVALVGGPSLDVGGVGSDLLASGRLRLGEWVAIGAFVAVPLVGTTVEAKEGSADVRTGALGADVGVVLAPLDGGLLVIPSIGFGGAVLTTSGDATSPYDAANDSTVAALPFGRLEVSPHLAGPFRLSLQGVLGVAAPPVAVQFAGREVATWGAPWATLGFGAAATW